MDLLTSNKHQFTQLKVNKLFTLSVLFLVFTVIPVISGFTLDANLFKLNTNVPVIDGSGDTNLNTAEMIGFDVLINDYDGHIFRDCMLTWSGSESNYTQSNELGSLFASEGSVTEKLEAEDCYYHNFGLCALQGQSFLETVTLHHGKLTLTLTSVPAGVYTVWAKVYGRDYGSNEFHYTIDNDNNLEDARILEFEPYELGFTWVKLPEAVVMEDSYASHTLPFRGTERFARLDKILFTNDGNKQLAPLPAPGINGPLL